MKNLIKAVLNVMSEVKGIDKSMTIGSGNNAYKGVPDKEVKKIIGESMAKNGLVLFQTDIIPTMKVERWEELDNYSKAMKTKQSILTEVLTTYELYHESGESITIKGYGHGVDSQDKSAGKATTYALKYALLYTFLIPTGKIDDADANHSDSYQVTQKQPLTKLDDAKKALQSGAITLEQIKKKYSLTKEQENFLCQK